MTLRYGNLRIVKRAKLSKIGNEASKIIGKMQKHLNNLYRCQVNQKASKIVEDASHPLFMARFNCCHQGDFIGNHEGQGKFVPRAVNI